MHLHSPFGMKKACIACRSRMGYMRIGGFLLKVKVKVLNNQPEPDLPNGNETTEKGKVLTSTYVRELNRRISHRIQLREISHADSANLAAKARFR